MQNGEGRHDGDSGVWLCRWRGFRCLTDFLVSCCGISDVLVVEPLEDRCRINPRADRNDPSQNGGTHGDFPWPPSTGLVVARDGWWRQFRRNVVLSVAFAGEHSVVLRAQRQRSRRCGQPSLPTLCWGWPSLVADDTSNLLRSCDSISLNVRPSTNCKAICVCPWFRPISTPTRTLPSSLNSLPTFR